MERKFLSIIPLALLLLSFFPLPGAAREALKEDFGKSETGADHKGPSGAPAYSRPERDFYFTPKTVLARKVDLGTAIRGVISFDLQRAQDADPSQRRTVFTLSVEGKDAKPFYVQVTWEAFEGRPMVHLRGPRFHMEGLGLGRGARPDWLPDWTKREAYTDHGDNAAAWAWEFLRRNPEYQADNAHYMSVPWCYPEGGKTPKLASSRGINPRRISLKRTSAAIVVPHPGRTVDRSTCFPPRPRGCVYWRP